MSINKIFGDLREIGSEEWSVTVDLHCFELPAI